MNTPAKLQVTVGQSIVFLPWTNYEDRPSFGWVVSRVTPSGKFEVSAKSDNGALSLTRYFNAQGYQLDDNFNGKVSRHGARVETDIAKWEARNLKHNLLQNAAVALNAVTLKEQVRHTWGKDSMVAKLAELEALLASARIAVGAL